MFPKIAHAALNVLDHCGVGAYLPDNQGCCGIPALSSGDLATFHKLLAHNLERFQAGDIAAIRDYCETDVLNTFLVYLRFELLRGRLTRAGYEQECELVRDSLDREEKSHLQAFLAAWPR